ncbi:hypothetical protein [Sphingomonas sp.]|jgi:hypothetical protein
MPVPSWIAEAAPGFVGLAIGIFGWIVYKREAAKVAAQRQARGDKYRG